MEPFIYWELRQSLNTGHMRLQDVIVFIIFGLHDPPALRLYSIVRPELRIRLRLRQNPAILAGSGSGLPPAPVILAGSGSGLPPAPVVSKTLNNRRMLTGVSNHIYWYLS